MLCCLLAEGEGYEGSVEKQGQGQAASLSHRLTPDRDKREENALLRAAITGTPVAKQSFRRKPVAPLRHRCGQASCRLFRDLLNVQHHAVKMGPTGSLTRGERDLETAQISG